jgi:hypothetical protein
MIGLLFALSACGAARDLKPAEGKALPVAPYGATATPTPTALLTPSTQARPGRSDELLTSSEERKGDEYDLPPAN